MLASELNIYLATATQTMGKEISLGNFPDRFFLQADFESRMIHACGCSTHYELAANIA